MKFCCRGLEEHMSEDPESPWVWSLVNINGRACLFLEYDALCRSTKERFLRAMKTVESSAEDPLVLVMSSRVSLRCCPCCGRRIEKSFRRIAESLPSLPIENE